MPDQDYLEKYLSCHLAQIKHDNPFHCAWGRWLHSCLGVCCSRKSHLTLSFFRKLLTRLSEHLSCIELSLFLIFFAFEVMQSKANSSSYLQLSRTLRPVLAVTPSPNFSALPSQLYPWFCGTVDPLFLTQSGSSQLWSPACGHSQLINVSPKIQQLYLNITLHPGLSSAMHHAELINTCHHRWNELASWIAMIHTWFKRNSRKYFCMKCYKTKSPQFSSIHTYTHTPVCTEKAAF